MSADRGQDTHVVHDQGPSRSTRLPRVPGSQMLTGLLAAPVVWIAQTLIAEVLVAQYCVPDAQSRVAPAWIAPATGALSVVCLLIACGGTWVAWRNVRRTARIAAQPEGGPRDIHGGRERFLVCVGALSSTIFLFGALATDVAVVLLSPCRGW
ncbi:MULTISPECIES: hypothetical protein [Paraburkholderia]|uniref:Uncharacterized protein n=1 Tax=Paraburkholderia acidicola TaxID=1912599 RepID=A0ABV1LYH8_9BURK